jgi:hypothetical protein
MHSADEASNGNWITSESRQKRLATDARDVARTDEGGELLICFQRSTVCLPTGLFRICWLSLSIRGREFEASRSVAGAFHFVLQFVEEPAELRRVLLGAREFDRPIFRVAQVGVQEAMQFDRRALQPGRAPCEALPRHSVVFLFHRFWFFLVLAGPYAGAQDRV